tara:strand:- start:7423 stop:8904 length:1482 start_codon:yes stop_codon:yes gene_type:complete
MNQFFDGKVTISNPDAFYIGGEWVSPASAKRIEIISPVTELVAGSIPEAVEQDVERAVAAARTAFENGPWPRMSVAERKPYFARLLQALQARTDELAHAWTGQIGAAFTFAQGGTQMAHMQFQFQLDNADSYVWQEQRPSMYPGSVGLVVREPVGVVAAIAPWNAPYFSLAIKVAPALMAGCTVVMKPSPESPLEAYILCECIEAAGFPAGVVNMIVADREVSDYLVRQPGIDKVSFTGSTTAGKRIGAVCADRVARFTLELGGKSPAIVLDDMEISTAVSILAPTLTMLSGQVCSNLTRFLISRKRHDEFVDAMATQLQAIKVGDPYAEDTQMGPLAMKRQLERVESYVEKGVSGGAKLVTGGKRPSHLNRGFFFEPTLFADVDNSSVIAQEEIFGPVACVTAYDDLDDAIRLANETSYGLAGAVFTNDADAACRLARSVKAGTISQNGLKPDFQISFGGFKQSGIGREGGIEAVNPYLETKTLILDSFRNK